MEKLGLSPAVVHAINPKVIYGRLSGFGQQESELRDRAGHDLTYLAVTGVLDLFHGAPPANVLADFAAGSTHLFSQILQARLLKKPCTVIDCSLAHSTLYLSQLALHREPADLIAKL